MKRIIEILACGVDTDSDTPVANGFVTFYDAGTTNLRTCYSDFALTTPLANPATLDADGKLIAYTDRRVKLFIQTAALATVRTIDDVGTADSDLTLAAASDLAGSGLTAPGDGTLAANVDGVTIEINSDALRVKDAGISSAKIADASVTKAKMDAATTSQAQEACNLTLTASVAANALTVAVKTLAGTDATSTDPITVGFRDSTITSGLYLRRQITGALSVVVSSGSTLGHVSATAEPIYIYLVDNGGTVELAVSTRMFDCGSVQTTTAEGGAGAADSRSVMYSTAARTSKAVRLVGRLASTQATAGTWASAITEIALFPFPEKAVQIERGGPLLVKKSGSSNTAYLQKSDATQNYPVVVSADPTSATANGMMIVRGEVSSAGAVAAGEGFTSAKNGTGDYTVTFSTAFSAAPMVVCTGKGSLNRVMWLSGTSTTAFTVFSTVGNTGSSGDSAFQFIAIGERPA